MKSAAHPAALPLLKPFARAAAMAAIGACWVPHALAQTSPAQAEAGLQSVVITAQKRPQSMQDVPVAVNMVDARAIENQRIVDFSDLTRVAPSMTLNQNPNNSTIALRGIGTFAYSIGIESTMTDTADSMPML